MRGAVLLFSSILWLSIPGFGQGEIHIEGSDDGKISVRASGKRGGDSTDIRARFERSGDFGRLRVTGGPSSDVTITVQVPKSSGLRVRITAGEVEVRDVIGN